MQKYTNKIFCFSPPVMLATFVIEIILVFYTLWRYKLNPVTRLVAATLVFLAIFQLAEYMVCGGMAIGAVDWSRIGYISITMLPPLGIHLAYQIARAKNRPLLWPAYFSAAVFVGFFVFVPGALTGHECQGNYVIFQTAPGSMWLYGLYYYGLVVGGAALCWKLAKEAKDKYLTKALRGVTVGYLAFLLPTTTINFIDPTTTAGIPSIMCGFAVLYAVALTMSVLPHYAKAKE